MNSYFLNQWIISRRFAKSDTGYVYRRRPDLPGIAVTPEERDAVLRRVRQRYWRYLILMWAGLVIGAVVVVLTAAVFGLGDNFLSFAAYVLVAALLGFALWEQRRLTELPETMFADHPRLEPEFPTTGWLGRFQRLSRNRSWGKHAAFIVVYGTMTWFLAPRSSEVSTMQWFLFGCCAVSLVMLLYGMIHKAMHASGEARN